MPKVKWTNLCQWTDKQRQAHEAATTHKYVLYGGAMGGGKSRWLRWELLYWLMHWAGKGHKRVVVGMFCEDYPALKDRQISKIAAEFPQWLGQHHENHKDYGNCYLLAPEYGSGVLAFRNLDDPSKYQSAEFAAIAVDELTKNPKETFDFLRTRLRWPGIPDVKFLAGTNPGGIGHGWVRQLWVDGPNNDPESASFRFVPALAADNPHLDQSYYHSLEGLPEKLRKAFVDGRWDVFAGQAFPELGEKHKFSGTIPAGSKIYVSLDYGYSKPWCALFFGLDYDGRLWLYHEEYGYGGSPNVGSHEDIDTIGRRISTALGGVKPAAIYAGPDWFDRSRGRSLAELLIPHGLILCEISTPPGSRKARKALFHDRLAGDNPGLKVHESCKHWWRTIPELVYDANRQEDIDTDGEDHCYDATLLMLSTRPWRPVKPQTALTDSQRWALERKRRAMQTNNSRF